MGFASKPEGGATVRYHRCPRCGWERYLTTIPKELVAKITVPMYGEITVKRLAQLDVANHNCEEYLSARSSLRNYLADIKLRRFAGNRQHVEPAEAQPL